jgi:hypothetical protein
MLCGRPGLNRPKHVANETLSKSLYPILNRAFVSPKTERAFLMIVGVYFTSCKPIVEKQLREEKAIKNINIEFMTVSLYTLAHH